MRTLACSAAPKRWQGFGEEDLVVSGPDLQGGGRVGCAAASAGFCVKESVKASEFATKTQNRIITAQKSLPK